MDTQTRATSVGGQLVTFFLSEEEFGIPIGEVQEIVRPSAITSVPNAPDYVKGIANLRGNVLPIMDLRARLGMARKEEDENTRVIVVNVNDRTTGLVVDSVSGVLHVDSACLDSDSETLQHLGGEYLQAVAKTKDGKRLTLILSTQEILPQKMETKNVPCAAGTGGTRHSEDEGTAGSEEQLLVTFKMAGEEFGVGIEEVQEIIRVGEITDVPKAHPFVKGITLLRDVLLPVVDLCILLKLDTVSEKAEGTGQRNGEDTLGDGACKSGSAQDEPPQDSMGDARRIVVIDIGGTPMGILVDSVSEVLRLPKDSIDEPPGFIKREHDSTLKGVAKLDGGKRLIMLLDIMNLISGEQKSVLADLGGQRKECTEDMEEDATNEQQVVCFRVQEEEYGIDIMKVQEIIRIGEITSVPNSPSYIEGIVNLRGSVLPVIDMRTCLGIQKAEHIEQNRIIVVDMSGNTTGIIVDSVSEVLRIPNVQIEPPPTIVEREGGTNRYLQGVAKLEGGNRIVMLVDIDSLFDVQQRKQISTLQSAGENKGSEPPGPIATEVVEEKELEKKEKREAASSNKKKRSSKKGTSKATKATKKRGTKTTKKKK